MAHIEAFAGIRFGPASGAGSDISALVSPPYDVLDPADKERLIGKSPNNIVAIDLPFAPAKKAGPDELYERSAATLKKWLEAGVLVQDDSPAFYVYHQRFTWQGESYTRRLFFCRLRLEPFGEGSVFPHELTFGGPKEDRLKLMQTTRCQISSIFSLFNDPKGEALAVLESAIADEPDAIARQDEVENRLWRVTDGKIIESVRAAMRDKKIYVADGHHRYGTAMMYRDWLTEQEGGLADDHPAHYLLTALSEMDDPGMLILPTHRVLVEPGDLTDDQILQAWSEGLELTETESADVTADFTLFAGRSGKHFSARIRDRGVLQRLEPTESEAWCGLDMAYLHRYLIDELLVARRRNGNPVTVRYVQSVEDAESAARDGAGVAVLASATSMAQLRAVSEAGSFMPQKSTFFFPKLATGMVINPLAPSIH